MGYTSNEITTRCPPVNDGFSNTNLRESVDDIPSAHTRSPSFAHIIKPRHTISSSPIVLTAMQMFILAQMHGLLGLAGFADHCDFGEGR